MEDEQGPSNQDKKKDRKENILAALRGAVLLAELVRLLFWS